MTAAIVAAAAALTVAAGCLYALRRVRQPHPGRHVNAPFADPADTADPDGERFIAQLNASDIWTHTIRLADPAADNLALLATVAEKLRGLPPAQPVAGRPIVRPAGPAFDPSVPKFRPMETQPIPHAVGTWGMTAPDLADELARKYTEVSQ